MSMASLHITDAKEYGSLTAPIFTNLTMVSTFLDVFKKYSMSKYQRNKSEVYDQGRREKTGQKYCLIS